MTHARCGLIFFALFALGCPPAKPGAATPPPAPSAGAVTPAPSAGTQNPQPEVTPEAGPQLEIYPKTIAPPKGQQWPVEIKPLPPALAGVPPSDRRYIETVFTIMLEATDAKIRLLHAIKRRQEGQQLVDGGQPAKLKDKVRRYRAQTGQLQERLAQMTPPETLKAFHQALSESIGQQLLFFKATLENKVAWDKMPELASAKRSRYLSVRAWTLLKKAYPKLGEDTAASFKSHLDALRLY